jgi:hypothetical protein
MSRGAGAPDRVLPRKGRRGSADYLFGIQRVPAGFWACQWYTNLGPEPKFRTGRVLGGAGGDALTRVVGAAVWPVPVARESKW